MLKCQIKNRYLFKAHMSEIINLPVDGGHVLKIERSGNPNGVQSFCFMVAQVQGPSGIIQSYLI